MPRRHALTDAEHQLIQEGLARLLREAKAALQAEHLITEGKAQLRTHAAAIGALATRMAETQQTARPRRYEANRLKQQMQRRKASQERRLRKNRRGALMVALPDVSLGFVAPGQ